MDIYITVNTYIDKIHQGLILVHHNTVYGVGQKLINSSIYMKCDTCSSIFHGTRTEYIKCIKTLLTRIFPVPVCSDAPPGLTADSHGMA